MDREAVALEDSLVVQIIWHDNRWRGGCKDPLGNTACLDTRFDIWGEIGGQVEEINRRKQQECADPSKPGHCHESAIFSKWQWVRWKGTSPAPGRHPPYILFVAQPPGGPSARRLVLVGVYRVDRIEPDSHGSADRVIYARPEASTWFSPEVEIPLDRYVAPSNRMASKGLYINTPLARRILRDVLKAHRNLLASGEVEPSSVAELREIIHKIENSLYEPTDGEGDELGQMEQILRLKGQIVLAGPPGVGKTYQALRLAARMLGLDPEDDEGRKERQLAAILRQNPDLQGDSARLAQAVLSGPPPRGVWDIVQFHSSYTYEDFVRGIQAEPERDGIVFRPVNRLLGTLAELARRLGPEVPVVLVVDEINRGDLAKVLGELIYSLEYRDHVVLTPYAVNGRPGLEIPANFYLIGTMNTADRAIALVDYAIRRRFSFIHLAPDRDVVAMHYEDPVLREKALHLFDQVQKLFVEVGAGYVAEDLAVGHSYFLASDADDLASRIAFEVAPLLVEYYKEGILVDPPVLNLEGKVNLVEVDPLQLERQVRGWLAGE